MANLRDKLVKRVATMSEGQLGLVSVVVGTFDQKIVAKRAEASDLVDEKFLEAFGDFLKLHHSLSKAYLDKTRFEVALERILKAIGRKAECMSRRTHRGHDITIDGSRFSLKTQGDASIKPDSLFISKFMELGGGNWGDTDLEDLRGLRAQFLDHLDGYDRILQLRYTLVPAGAFGPAKHHYELVEIPKRLMLEAKDAQVSWADRSRTNPRCGYCTIADDLGRVKFRLYFDGGGERKLQIKDLAKTHCTVHASWEFEDISPATSNAP